MFNFSFSQFFAASVFGAVGFVAFIYGKKQTSWKPMVWGVLLMALPYLVQQATALWAAGALILAAMYVFRD